MTKRIKVSKMNGCDCIYLFWKARLKLNKNYKTMLSLSITNTISINIRLAMPMGYWCFIPGHFVYKLLSISTQNE